MKQIGLKQNGVVMPFGVDNTEVRYSKYLSLASLLSMDIDLDVEPEVLQDTVNLDDYAELIGIDSVLHILNGYIGSTGLAQEKIDEIVEGLVDYLDNVSLVALNTAGLYVEGSMKIYGTFACRYHPENNQLYCLEDIFDYVLYYKLEHEEDIGAPMLSKQPYYWLQEHNQDTKIHIHKEGQDERPEMLLTDNLRGHYVPVSVCLTYLKALDINADEGLLNLFADKPGSLLA